LVDETGVGQYNNLKEKGYFSIILRQAQVAEHTKRIHFVIDQTVPGYYGKQRIDRRSANAITRSIIN